jgi:hypothetical protein
MCHGCADSASEGDRELSDSNVYTQTIVAVLTDEDAADLALDELKMPVLITAAW